MIVNTKCTAVRRLSGGFIEMRGPGWDRLVVGRRASVAASLRDESDRLTGVIARLTADRARCESALDLLSETEPERPGQPALNLPAAHTGD